MKQTNEMKMKKIIAIFHPQAWVNDYAIAVDPEGEREWDVTEEILKMRRKVAMAIRDDEYSSDCLRESESAPKWARDWSGPFWIEVEQAIADYFEAEGK